MQRREDLARLILVSVVVLGLTVVVDAQAQIAFASVRTGDSEIYVMDADGGNLQNLTNNKGFDEDPSWSADGMRIAFISDRDLHPLDRNWDIYVMDADGGNPRNLTEHPWPDMEPSWSPDGKHIAYISRHWSWEIYVMDVDGGNHVNLTKNFNNDWFPSWSPDGERIAFVSDRDGNDEIYMMDADGGNEQRLTNNRFEDRDPSWSPDGRWIVFSAIRTGHFENWGRVSSEIYMMDADGGNEQRLTNNRRYDSHPSWSPDGKRIVFSGGRNRTSEIYVMDADGGNLKRLTNSDGWDGDPTWDPSALAVSPAGKIFTTWGWLKQLSR